MTLKERLIAKRDEAIRRKQDLVELAMRQQDHDSHSIRSHAEINFKAADQWGKVQEEIEDILEEDEWETK